MTRPYFWLSLVSVALCSCTFVFSSSPSVTTDADPTAPDADPNAPDANPAAPDANLAAPDANLAVPDANPNAPDAQPGVVGVSCGGGLCVSGQECCTDYQSFSMSCVDLNTCTADYKAQCDGPEDCTGQICCGGFTVASCAGSCGFQEAELCALDTDCLQSGAFCCDVGLQTRICRADCSAAFP